MIDIRNTALGIINPQSGRTQVNTLTYEALTLLNQAVQDMQAQIIALQITGGGVVPRIRTVSGNVDGTNATFNMTAAPTTGCLVFVDGAAQRQVADDVGDFSLAGATITFVTPPHEGAIIYSLVW